MKTLYLIRLDDACNYYDAKKWYRMEALLDKYSIKPIVAIIPDCKDPLIREKYVEDKNFWNKAKNWQKKGWTIALHGYNHVYCNQNTKGINPINNFSEFAGVTLNEQKEKIRNGLKIFKKIGLIPKVFVAPAHSFDENTLKALEKESNIRIISDTIASNIYYKYRFYFIPQQCGSLRKLPLKIVTGCYHPNIMDNRAFKLLDLFLKAHLNEFVCTDDLEFDTKGYTLFDYALNFLYFTFQKIRKIY